MTILAIDRSSPVTSSGALWSTRAAVSRWMSASRANASREVLVARHVGEDPQLDLAVVRGDQRGVRRPGHERVPDPAAERRPDRDVLEVRVGRGQAPGGRHGLVEQRVEPPVGPDQVRQRLHVRRAQLRVGPPVQHQLDDRVDAAQLLEDRRVRRVAGLGLAALGQAQLHEQQLAQLLGAADGELVADDGVDLRLEAGDLGRELALEGGQRVLVERDAGRLHPGEDRDQRQLDLGEQALDALVAERLLERWADGERRRGPRGRRRRRAAAPRPSAAGRGPARSATTSAIFWARSAALTR